MVDTRSKTATTQVLGVELSQPAKSLWPDDGSGRPVSKLELACYYEAVAAWMMPHLKGRPCSLVRAPDGIGAQRFFQRHAMPGRSNRFETIKVPGETRPYLVINRAEELISAAQAAALELHPWNCAPDAPDVPGRLVFDLDPAPELAFDAVVGAALALRERLAALGLESFCKTTGGKGLHVVVPLARERRALDWPTAAGFARTLCTQMAADDPGRYLVSMAKRARTGRVFLDYLRNERTATAVAPLSTRARSGAPVSMPLRWSQVRSGLDPLRYMLRSAPKLLVRSDPWERYTDSSQPLRAAAARLMRSRAKPAS